MVETYNLQTLPRKQQQLIEAARELFCVHGIRRVTIGEICKNASVSKVTYYKYFSKKWDIARTVIDVLFDEVTALQQGVLEEDISFPQKVEKILKLNREQFNTIGAAFINDLLNEDSPLHPYFLGQHKKTREIAIVFFKNAQREGLIHSDIKMPFLLFMLDHLSDLVNHPEFVQIMPDIEDRICELSKFFFHGFARTQALAG